MPVENVALSKSTDWNTADDAGNITITNAKGNITGLCTYGDHVIVFTEHSMHELYDYGSPSNWRLVDITNDIGCISDKTLVEIKGVLYWLDYNGVYAFTGGLPQKISDKVQKYINGINFTYKSLCEADKHEDKMYLAIPYGSTANNRNLVFNTRRNTWFVENTPIKYMTNIRDTLYGMNTTGLILNMVSTSTNDYNGEIPWSFETKCYNYDTIQNQKVITDFNILYKASTVLNIGLFLTKSSNLVTFSSNSFCSSLRRSKNVLISLV